MIQEASYVSGEVICQGDRVMCGDLSGTVTQIMPPESVQAVAHDCRETGGFLIELDYGDCQLWVKADEDLVFIGRAR